MAKKAFFFPHDGNARNDEKLLAVRMRFGMEGYGIYFALVEKLLESSDYILLKDYNAIAFELRVGAEKVKSVVEDFGLFQFTECGKLFYSTSLNSRMNPLEEIRSKRSVAGRKGAEKRWSEKQKIANAINENDKCHDFAIEKNSRVEESKGENISLPNARTHVGDLFPPDDVFDKPLSECHDELKSNQAWMETFCMNIRAVYKNFTPAMFCEYLDAYFRKLACEGITRKAPKDAQSHFYNWLKIKLENQKRNGNKNPKSDKRGVNPATDYAAAANAPASLDEAARLFDYLDGKTVEWRSGSNSNG